MSLPEFDVSGQKVLIVGAGRGIGKGIALAFAEAGSEVAVASLTEATVGKVAEEITAMGGKALPVTGDATKTADMDKITSVESLGAHYENGPPGYPFAPAGGRN